MNNKLTDERPDDESLEFLITIRREIAERHASEGRMGQCAVHTLILNALLELQKLRKADSEPAGYHVIKECGKVGCSVATLEEAEKTRDFWNKKWIIKPYFYAPPVQETGVYKDMLNIINLLENNEWAEHCTGTVLGSLLESEITRLVSKEQPAPVVPEGLVKAVRFYEQVKRENPPVETGAWKDAVDWVLKEACKAVSMLESSREHEVISQQEKA